jgi:uncharacterized membrane protein YfcA
VSAPDVVLLVVAGVVAGLTGSIAGLASLASYPALLAVGLPPVTANVTNTVALICSTVGSVSASRVELRGQRARVRRLALVAVGGGLCGAALLLLTPSRSFELVVPWFIAVASLCILARGRVESVVDHVHRRHDGRAVTVGVALIGVYGGYFGAAAGVLLLALLLWATGESLPRSNAVKNVVLGAANAVAALAFVCFADVRWSAVLPLGVGLLVGGRTGPAVVRRAPAAPLRVVIGLAGLALAATLAVDVYG